MKPGYLSWSPAIAAQRGGLQIFFKYIAIFTCTFWIISGCNESGLTKLSDSPVINSTVPGSNAINIAVNTAVDVTFNKRMDPSSIHEGNFQIFEDRSAVAGEINCEDSTATFNPSKNFTENTLITVRIGADVADLDGNTMDDEYEWSFTTGDEPVSGPGITATNPSGGATGIPINTTVIATFDDTMNASTINTATFLLRMESTNIAGEVDYSGTTAIFTPANNLQNGQNYRATITNDVRNRNGNSLGEDYDWQFTTEKEETPPKVTATNPGDGTNDVSVNTTVSATFSEEVDPATISAETFMLSEDGNSVDGAVQYSNQTATFEPFSNLNNSTTYTARITTGVKDPAGNSLEQTHQWSFTTEAADDITPPEVVETNPEDDNDDVSRNVTITAEFNELLDPATVSDETVILERERFFREARRIAATISYSDNVISIDPDKRLRKEEDYTVTLTTGITDVAGNALSSEYEWEFETEDD